MERTICCIDLPSRGAAPGTPVRWLATAWRDAAALGGPAAVLVLRDGVLVVAWANDALGALLGRDVADLAGRPLRELADPDANPDADPDADPDTGPDTGPDGRLLISWARLAHQLARVGGGTGVGALRGPDGADTRVHLVVRIVDVEERAPAPGPDGVHGAHGVHGVHGGHGEAAGPGRGILPPWVIGELPPSPEPRCWLVDLEPVSDAVAEAEAALTVAENRFTALASCAPVGIFASSAGLRLGYVNDHFVHLADSDAAALLGNGWLDAIHREDLPAVYTAVQTVLSGTPVELAVRVARVSGVPRWLQLRLAPTTTPARAAGFIGTAEDVTDRRSWEEHLFYQAHHDSLTGLVNRRRLLDVLAEQLSGRRGRHRDFAVLFMDLDRFKEINDTLGHAAGDRALIEVARRLQRVARDSDVIARMSGDEFVVVLLSITDVREAEAAARRHLSALAEPVRIGTDEVRLSASIGVALLAGFDTLDSLLRAADRLMYEAKAAGHGLYRLAPVGSSGEGR